MTGFRSNLLANYVGAGWVTLLGLACTPLYIRLMGIEAYGLVGFYLLLTGMTGIVDFGLTPAMNREMARYSVIPEKAGEARDLFRTVEIGYWVTGAVLGGVLLFTAPYISAHWIQPGDLPHADVRFSVMVMGSLIALQRPLGLYQGGMMGLQRQVALNGINIVAFTLASVGSVMALWLISPSVRVFFIWQIVVSAMQTGATTYALWHYMPPSGRPARLEPGLLRNLWRFAAGMSGIAIASIILMQMDKIILSRLLPLKIFGYYILACAVSNGMTGVFIAPLFNAIFPRFSLLVAARDEKGLSGLYHASTQLMSVLILPAAVVIALYSREVMFLWTRDAGIAAQTAPIVSFLVIGTALNGLMNTPYALQLSHGWTRIGLLTSVFFIVTMVPAILLAIRWYGPVGAASVWVLLNATYIAIGVPLTHRRLLRGEAGRWFARDFIPPLLAVILVAGFGRVAFPSPQGGFLQAIEIGVLYITATISSLAAARDLRKSLFDELLPSLNP